MVWTVLYYESPNRAAPIEAFLDGLSEKARAKCLVYIGLLESHGTQLPTSIVKHVRGKIWELRPEWGGNEYRFFYGALIGRRFVILHVVEKKTQKLREGDIQLAEQRYVEVQKRLKHEDPSSVRRRTD